MRSAVVLASLLIACASSEEDQPSVVTDAAVESGTDAPSDSRADIAFEAAPDAACKLVAKYSAKNPTCNACAEANCCEEINACLGNTGCNDDYVNCILACALLPNDAGDATAEKERCLNECATSYPDGKRRYDAAIGCAENRCATECT
jgi:hypothetical protein